MIDGHYGRRRKGPGAKNLASIAFRKTVKSGVENSVRGRFVRPKDTDALKPCEAFRDTR